uniref:Uncharacterized protein n=1 Tax=Leersia perrieri TaxID=77586 RepID=A0A0D9VSE9_9ORYZ
MNVRSSSSSSRDEPDGPDMARSGRDGGSFPPVTSKSEGNNCASIIISASAPISSPPDFGCRLRRSPASSGASPSSCCFRRVLTGQILGSVGETSVGFRRM